MAKRKRKPKPVWVRIKPDAPLAAGTHFFGPFPSCVGDMQKKPLTRKWELVDGVWAAALAESNLAFRVDISETDPYPI